MNQTTPSIKTLTTSSKGNNLVRHPANPILKASDLPYASSLTFNAGVAKYQGRYVMVFRNDYGITETEWREREKSGGVRKGFETSLGLAYSRDGVTWEVQSKPCWEIANKEIKRVYDPRLTVIDGKVYICFAMDTAHGVRGGIATTGDFSHFEILSLSVPDNRNMVLFPEKIGGTYFRLERPFTVYSRGKDRFDLWSGRSPDLRYWGDHELVLAVEDVPFANDKIGPAAPPIKTPKGWLTTFHAVWKDNDLNLGGWESAWHKKYYGGIMLLDLENPSKVIGICRDPLLSPETDYEKKGFRNEVIFPGGMILEDSGEVKIYYGAADTVEALATIHVDALLALCQPV